MNLSCQAKNCDENFPAKRKTQKYCSSQCSNLTRKLRDYERKPHGMKQCQVDACGREFRALTGNVKYCSDKCRAAARTTKGKVANVKFKARTPKNRDLRKGTEGPSEAIKAIDPEFWGLVQTKPPERKRSCLKCQSRFIHHTFRLCASCREVNTKMPHMAQQNYKFPDLRSSRNYA